MVATPIIVAPTGKLNVYQEQNGYIKVYSLSRKLYNEC